MEIPQLHNYLRMPQTLPLRPVVPLPEFRLLPRPPRVSPLTRWLAPWRWDKDHHN